MASSKEYLEFVLEQLSELDDITYRAMMGEYIIYYRGKVAGGIYDDRFLVKPVQAARELMPNARLEKPYDGAKDMLLADELEDREFLKKLFEAMYEELPAPKKKKETQSDMLPPRQTVEIKNCFNQEVLLCPNSVKKKK